MSQKFIFFDNSFIDVATIRQIKTYAIQDEVLTYYIGILFHEDSIKEALPYINEKFKNKKSRKERMNRIWSELND